MSVTPTGNALPKVAQTTPNWLILSVIDDRSLSSSLLDDFRVTLDVEIPLL